jgi:hypothetical protein
MRGLALTYDQQSALVPAGGRQLSRATEGHGAPTSNITGTAAAVFEETGVSAVAGTNANWLRVFDVELKQFASAAAALASLTARMSGADVSPIQPDVDLLQRMARQALSRLTGTFSPNWSTRFPAVLRQAILCCNT